jgi:hypothetical protein
MAGKRGPMSAERDQVAAREIADYYGAGESFVEKVASALSTARRLGAEEMRERCAKIVQGRIDWAHSYIGLGAANTLCVAVDDIRSLPLPPEVGA